MSDALSTVITFVAGDAGKISIWRLIVLLLIAVGLIVMACIRKAADTDDHHE